MYKYLFWSMFWSGLAGHSGNMFYIMISVLCILFSIQDVRVKAYRTSH